jgi:hypothetical protein
MASHHEVGRRLPFPGEAAVGVTGVVGAATAVVIGGGTIAENRRARRPEHGSGAGRVTLRDLRLLHSFDLGPWLG